MDDDFATVNNMPEPDGFESAMEMEGAPAEASGGSGGSEPGLDNPFDKLLVTGKGPPRTDPGGARTRTVIGADDRVRILETRSYPWRAICSLNIVGGVATFVGSGALIGPRTVLTAGHCVHHKTMMGGWAKRIAVSPGRDGATMPFGTTVARRFSSLQGWLDRQDPDFDVGCIHLEEPIGDKVGTFALAAMSDAQLRDAFLNIAGYPADRGGGAEMYFHADRVEAVGPHRVFYEIDTYGGQSGAPVWVYPDGDKTRPVQVAIHAYGVGGTPVGMARQANSAPRILPALLDQIKQWLAEDG